MKFRKLSFIIIFINMLIISCDSYDNIKAKNDKNSNSKSTQNTNKKEYLPDSERQKEITEDYLKDNFNLDELRKIDWSNTENYGPSKNFITLNKVTSHNFIENTPMLKELGAKDDDYYVAKVAGDGDCWITASAQTIFYLIFNNNELFDELIAKLPLFITKYQDLPGFKDRFLYEEFITLLQTLKSLPAKERITQFNKEHSYKLINYTFRTLIHANKFSERKDSLPYDYNNEIKQELKEFLTNNSWGAARGILALFTNMLKNTPIINLFYNSTIDNKNYYNLNFSINSNFSQIPIYTDLNDFFNNQLDEPYIKTSLEDFKTAFNVDKKEDLLNQPLLQVIPQFVNGNHYNLLINKNIAQKFGY